MTGVPCCNDGRDGVAVPELPSERRLAMVAWLLEKRPKLLMGTNDNESTPLHVAAHFGDVEVVRLLLQKADEADANLLNSLTKSGAVWSWCCYWKA